MRVCVFVESFEIFTYIQAGRQLSNNLFPHLSKRQTVTAKFKKADGMTDTIYKYVDFHGLECIFKNKTLRFKHPRDFKDPLEFHDRLVDRKLNIRLF